VLAFFSLATLLSPLMGGCTPVRSTLLPPYRLEGAWFSGAELGQRAEQRCLSDGRTAAALPPMPFTTDGCTLVPGRTNTDCCIAHDIAYWCGGPANLRVVADRVLRRCVAAHSGALAASAVYVGVRIGGSGWLPFPWRWGYGFPWPHPGGERSHRKSAAEVTTPESNPHDR
jgi:hypothetical protein